MHPKRVACEDSETKTNEIEVDAALQSLMSHKISKSDYITHVENVKNLLEESESSIHDLDEMLECLLRCLIKPELAFLTSSTTSPNFIFVQTRISASVISFLSF